MCRFFHRRKNAQTAIPTEVSESERLLRFILSPLHFNKKGALRSNAYNPTVNSNEISVTRLDYSSIEECKRLAHKMDCSEDGKVVRSYRGFGLLNKGIALACGAVDVIGSPKDDNPAHADILLESVRENGPLPAHLQLVVDSLLEKSKYLKDPSPESKGWKGDPIVL